MLAAAATKAEGAKVSRAIQSKTFARLAITHSIPNNLPIHLDFTKLIAFYTIF